MQAVSGRKSARKRSREQSARPAPGWNLAAAIQQPNFATIILIVGIANADRVMALSAARWNLDDFSLHYTSAFALRQGLDPYATDLAPLSRQLGLVVGMLTQATDTPFFLMLFEPLTILPPYVAYWIWFGLGAGALAVSILLLFRTMPNIPGPARRIIVGMILMYVPVAQNFLFSQSQAMVLLMLTLTVIFMDRGREEAAGAAIGFAVLLRGYPIAILGYFAVRRNWRALAPALATMAAGTIAAIMIGGVSHPLTFLTNAMPWITQPAFWGQWYNVSVGAFVARTFYTLFGLALDAPGLTAARIATAAADVGLVAVAVAMTIRRGARSDVDFRVFSLWIVTAIMISPTAWVHYMVLLILPFVLLSRAAIAGRASDRACWMAAINWAWSAFAAWFYASFHLGMFPVWRINASGFFIVMAEGSFFALIAGYAAIYWFAADAPSEPDSGRAVRHGPG